jgi:hypothetical protein
MQYDDDPQPLAAAAVPAAKGPNAKRRRAWRRMGFWFVVAIAGCLVVVGGRYGIRHFQVTNDLKTAQAELDQREPGWRLADLEASRAVLADDDNAALCVEEVDRIMAKTRPAPRPPATAVNGRRGGTPPANGPAGADPAQLEDQTLYRRLEELPPNERPSAADVARLRQDLKPHQDALAKARELADLPHGRFQLNRKPSPLFAPPQEVRQVDQATRLLSADSLLRAEEDDLKGAMRSCQALLDAARSLGDEPYYVSQLCRIGRVHLACHAIERVLGQGEVDANDLVALQKILQDEDDFPRLLVVARGERAVVNDLLEAVESGAVSLDDLNNLIGTRYNSPYSSLDSVDAVRADHPNLLRTMNEAVEIARLPPNQRPARVDAYEAKLKDGSTRSLLFTQLFDLRTIEAASRRLDARVRCLIAALAVERYRLIHHGWPETLKEVTPDLLSHVPADPDDGEALRYRRYEDRVVIYSRVPMKRDQHEVFDPDGPSAPGFGAAVHLFGPDRRRVTKTAP